MLKIFAVAFSILSISISIFFLWTAWLMLFESETNLIMLLFGCIAGIYGTGSTFLLGAAWLKPSRILSTAMKWLAVAALASVVMGSLDVGMISGLEWGLILVLGAVLLGKWYLLHRIVEYAMANKTLQPMR